MLRSIFAALRAAPVFWYYIFKDFGKYIKEKGWTRFSSFLTGILSACSAKLIPPLNPESCYKVSGEIDEKVPFTFVQSQHVSSGRVGKTIYLGKRKSGTYIRFYDEEQTGFKRFDYTSDLSSEELRSNISHQHFDYYQQYYMIVRKPKRVDHQGVLCSDV